MCNEIPYLVLLFLALFVHYLQSFVFLLLGKGMSNEGKQEQQGKYDAIHENMVFKVYNANVVKIVHLRMGIQEFPREMVSDDKVSSLCSCFDSSAR